MQHADFALQHAGECFVRNQKKREATTSTLVKALLWVNPEKWAIERHVDRRKGISEEIREFFRRSREKGHTWNDTQSANT
jgi:hypothetical protein